MGSASDRPHRASRRRVRLIVLAVHQMNLRAVRGRHVDARIISGTCRRDRGTIAVLIRRRQVEIAISGSDDSAAGARLHVHVHVHIHIHVHMGQTTVAADAAAASVAVKINIITNCLRSKQPAISKAIRLFDRIPVLVCDSHKLIWFSFAWLPSDAVTCSH